MSSYGSGALVKDSDATASSTWTFGVLPQGNLHCYHILFGKLKWNAVYWKQSSWNSINPCKRTQTRYSEHRGMFLSVFKSYSSPVVFSWTNSLVLQSYLEMRLLLMPHWSSLERQIQVYKLYSLSSGIYAWTKKDNGGFSPRSMKFFVRQQKNLTLIQWATFLTLMHVSGRHCALCRLVPLVIQCLQSD